MTGVPKLLRKRWVLISGSLLLLLLVVATGWYCRFGRPCQPADLCTTEPTADSNNPFVGGYEFDPLAENLPGRPSRRVVLHADGTFCRTVGGDRAQEGNWTLYPKSGFPRDHDDTVWQFWEIEFSVFRACGGRRVGPRDWSPVVKLSAVVSPDGSMTDIAMSVWWGLGPPTSLRKIR